MRIISRFSLADKNCVVVVEIGAIVVEVVEILSNRKSADILLSVVEIVVVIVGDVVVVIGRGGSSKALLRKSMKEFPSAITARAIKIKKNLADFMKIWKKNYENFNSKTHNLKNFIL